jgi:hypothetical protein
MLASTGMDDRNAWAERAAGFFAEQYGIPPIAGRILGWLMVCDPPAQSATGIAGSIGASRASLTSNMNLLTAARLVRKQRVPGDRTTYFRIDDDAWPRVVRERIAKLASFVDIAEDGLALFEPGDERAERVRAARDTFAWLAKALEEPR